MSVCLYLAPAAAGKTEYVLARARQAAMRPNGDWGCIVRVIVPTHWQVRAGRRRLAEMGGALGVRMMTFDRLYAECLNAAHRSFTELSEPVQHRLIRRVVDTTPLTHYAALTGRPGLVRALEGLFGELKAAQIWPEQLAAAAQQMPNRPDLADLADLYATYQAHLQAHAWADRAGLGWLAVESLQDPACAVGRDWPFVALDGFDSLTSVQLALIVALAGRVGELAIALTGQVDGDRLLAHKPFERMRRQLEAALGMTAQSLPSPNCRHDPALAALEERLFAHPRARGQQEQCQESAVELIAAADRAGEVRAALRWLKARLRLDGMRPGEVALLARRMVAYRPFVSEIAAELDLPVYLADGLPLRSNPAVAALLDLLRLMLPTVSSGEPALPYRLVIEAWRSPYLDWSVQAPESDMPPIGIAPGDADRLDRVARWGRVVGGLAQWRDALARLVGRSDQGAPAALDEERDLPADLPVGCAAQELAARFERFVQRLAPPQGRRAWRDFVGWLEGLIGPDPILQDEHFPPASESWSLQVVRCVRQGEADAAGRDLAALQAFKDVLRGLVWAQDTLAADDTDFAGLVGELIGAIEATAYQLPVRSDLHEILAADVIQARGLAFRAVAVLGLAEGEFPATLHPDPLLSDADRLGLRQLGLPLDLPTDSLEAAYFYQAVSRPRQRLLLTRPRLADNGSLWQASPFWEEVCRLANVTPQTQTSEYLPPPAQIASWPELMSSLAVHSLPGLAEWARREDAARCDALAAAGRVVAARAQPHADSSYDGDLSHMAAEWACRFGFSHVWSPSRLESYRACPLMFFIAHVLGLSPQEPPVEGLNVQQLGNLYHRILEQVYRTVPPPASPDELDAALPVVANRILDAAPQQEGFRATRWWQQTRQEIVANLRRTLLALEAERGCWQPRRWRHGLEVAFGLRGQPPLLVRRTEGQFCVRGLIDRVDRAPDDRLRIMDYKTGGPTSFDVRAVQNGKKLQLGLYALAARDALGLGDPTEGFYWHVRHAEPSGFTLSGFPGGAAQAIETVAEHAWAAVLGARSGHFVPHPPADGCPTYCPGRDFCWQWRPGYG